MDPALLRALVSVAAPPDLAVVRALIEGGAEVNRADEQGWTALHFAARTGALQVIERLLAAGAAPNAEDGQGLTPLHRYLWRPSHAPGAAPRDPAVVRAFLAHGARITPRLASFLAAIRSTNPPEIGLLAQARYAQLVEGALGRAGAPPAVPERVVVVDVDQQRVGLVIGGTMRWDWPASTAAAGIGGEAGSNRTPPGWHRIAARIGADAPLGTVFRGRVPTGERWTGEDRDEDLILTRILTLEGLEDGVNRGPGCDSLARYVYVHGTNQESRLGTPVSHGCVRLANADVVVLFDQVRDGDPVLVAP